MTFKAEIIDFTACSEDDLVRLFGRGLEAFIAQAGGNYASRRVTPRQEKTYPSDQDYAVLFRAEGRFSLHLFGLQFKRGYWRGSEREWSWGLPSGQLYTLQRSSRVVSYCFSRGCHLSPSNALHGFYFVNPRCIPSAASSVRLARHFHHEHIGHEDSNWAHMRLFADIVGHPYSEQIPRVTWGEFMDAVQTGAIIMSVPGGPEDPPPPDARAGPPGLHPETGIGLTIICDGNWGAAWARQHAGDFVRRLIDETLAPPAAVIALESFSRSLSFIEVY